MLQPANRLTLIDAMRPPAGFRLQSAMAVTFTLDLRALLAAPAAMAFTHAAGIADGGDAHEFEPIELIHALRSHANKITVFSQVGEIALPAGRRVFAFLERSVVRKMPNSAFRGQRPLVSFTATELRLRFAGHRTAIRHPLHTRGKRERFFRTVRQQFLAPLETDQLAGVADLDQRFHTWLESEYHRSPHRGLKGSTPLETWLAKCHLIVALDPTVDLAEAFRHQGHPQGPIE